MKQKIIRLPLLVLLLLLLFSANSPSVSEQLQSREEVSFQDLWKQVDHFLSKGLPKSARELVNQIYQQAQNSNQPAQMIKALIFRIGYFQQVEEDSFIKAHGSILAEISKAGFPQTSLLHSMLAEQYWNYYQQNRYRLLRRSTVSAEFDQQDIRTWDARKIVEAVVFHYKESLKNSPKLKQTKIDILEPLLHKGSNARDYRPTLFDFLGHRAVDFFINNEAGLTQPVFAFNLNDQKFFNNNKNFVKQKISSRDPLSFDYIAITLLQDLIKFHLEDEDPRALVDADLKRLRFVYSTAKIENKDTIYKQSLEQLSLSHSADQVSAEVSHEIALLYSRLGNKYNPAVSSDYKWHKKKALDLCRETEVKFPGSIGARNCLALARQLQALNLNLTIQQVVVPNKPFLALINYRNINRLHLRVIKTSREELIKLNKLPSKKMVTKFLAKPAIRQWQSSLPDDNDLQSHSTEIKIGNLGPGMYMLAAATGSEFNIKTNGLAYTFFRASNIAYIKRQPYQKGLEFYLINRESGQPLAGAQARIWTRTYSSAERRYIYQKGKLFTADNTGYLNLSGPDLLNQYFNIEFLLGSDRLYARDNFRLNRGYNKHTQTTRTFIFTDRAIYRPGQTVFFKTIFLRLDSEKGENSRILPGFNSYIKLIDVNRQEIARMAKTTNEYGTFSGSFQLPLGLLNGNMRLQTPYGSISISVEEYKRPKFKVFFNPATRTFRLNDQVTVTGEAKAYAGYSIDSAQVKYRVVREVFYPYSWCFSYFDNWYQPHTPAMEIISSTAKTRADGTFTIKFRAVPDQSINVRFKPAFRYRITADVTDLNGETRSGSKSIFIGESALKISLTLPQNLDKTLGELKATINSTTLSGDFIKAKGELAVYRLATPVRAFKPRLWNAPDRSSIPKKSYYREFPQDIYQNELSVARWKRIKKMFSTRFDTGESKQLVIKKTVQWPTGKYLVELLSRDSFGNQVKEIKYFTLYSSKSKELPYKMVNWGILTRQTLQPGQNAVILIGSALRDQKVIYEIEHQGRIVKSQILDLNNEQKQLVVPITEKHRGNLGIHLAFVRHNRFFSHNFNIYVPWTNKHLDLSFSSFRNKLAPGQKEEWQIKIKGPKGDQTAAEMVATLYDASLDAFRLNSWFFNVFPSHYLRLNWASSKDFKTLSSSRIGRFSDYAATVTKRYDRLNWFGVSLWQGRYTRYKKLGSAIPAPPPAARPGEAPASFDAAAGSEEGVVGGVLGSPGKREQRSGRKKNGDSEPAPLNSAEAEPVKVRTNFNETAFFYPHLKTNSKGEILISFTVPEALTSWKMMGFAHSRDLKYGSIQNQLVTQKDLMVVPNTPRFFREGDTVIYSSKISNLSQTDLTGNVQLQLFDAATMNPVAEQFGLDLASKPFTAKKGGSALVSWEIKIPEDLDAVTYRITASSGKFRDGEEQAVPILKNRMLVTESLPLPVRAGQTRSFVFKKLVAAAKSATIKNHRLTLEFTANPVWYAVQALPYLMEFPHECNEQVFSRYYANSIAAHIVKQHPAIKRVFDTWKIQASASDRSDKNALLSNLQKNPELKSLILQETPWVLNGKNEQERKKRIAVLFDLNQMGDSLSRALVKLRQAQMSSGAWSWFKGMRESRYITQHIITGFAHLKALKVSDPKKDKNIWLMVKKAISYLDSRITDDYQQLLRSKANMKACQLGHIQIHYLYARSYFDQLPIDQRDIPAFDYYKNQAKAYWTSFRSNKYLQGMIALALHRYKESEPAAAIMRSIKEHALYSPELGMYFKNPGGYYWYQAPIEVQALLIEAFDEILNDRDSVEQMKTWLLKQKQTQDWRTTKATAEACYALLLRGEEWLSENKTPVITLGRLKPVTIGAGNKLKVNNQVSAEAGTGYFKTSWSGKEIFPEMGFVKVINTNQVVAWGSLYWQYFENLDRITPAKTPLHINKNLFIEKPGKTGPVLVPISKNKRPVIGDRIKVRIEIRVDRHMEYVHMKDMRAAALEPEDVISRYKWQDGLGYYQSTKDASTNFFFDYLPRGTYVFEYNLLVSHKGDFSNGITTIQCMYAPEFSSHSQGERIRIGE